jgi:hypothetical protein
LGEKGTGLRLQVAYTDDMIAIWESEGVGVLQYGDDSVRRRRDGCREAR